MKLHGQVPFPPETYAPLMDIEALGCSFYLFFSVVYVENHRFLCFPPPWEKKMRLRRALVFRCWWTHLEGSFATLSPPSLDIAYAGVFPFPFRIPTKVSTDEGTAFLRHSDGPGDAMMPLLSLDFLIRPSLSAPVEDYVMKALSYRR